MNKTRWVKTIMIVSVLVVLLLLAGLAMGAGHQTIVETAVEDGRFDTMLAAVTAAGMADALSEGEWTVFAPTDEAFAKLDLNANNIAGAMTSEELADILLYHAMEGKKDTAALLGMVGDITMANGKLAGLKEFEGDLYVNDDSKVISPDIFASNGIIHVVDTVILPPWPRTEEDAITTTTEEEAITTTDEAPCETFSGFTTVSPEGTVGVGGELTGSREELEVIFAETVGTTLHIFSKVVIHTGDGDLFFDEIGTFDLTQEPPFLELGGAITGGTDRWDNASGGVVLSGPVSPNDKQDYKMVICTP